LFFEVLDLEQVGLLLLETRPDFVLCEEGLEAVRTVIVFHRCEAGI
jgi:hypothetical protein